MWVITALHSTQYFTQVQVQLCLTNYRLKGWFYYDVSITLQPSLHMPTGSIFIIVHNLFQQTTVITNKQQHKIPNNCAGLTAQQPVHVSCHQALQCHVHVVMMMREMENIKQTSLGLPFIISGDTWDCLLLMKSPHCHGHTLLGYHLTVRRQACYSYGCHLPVKTFPTSGVEEEIINKADVKCGEYGAGTCWLSYPTPSP